MFDELLEQDEFVQKQRARAHQEGQIEEDWNIIVKYFSICYPSLFGTDAASGRERATSPSGTGTQECGRARTNPVQSSEEENHFL